jgi:hypothetical protein
MLSPTAPTPGYTTRHVPMPLLLRLPDVYPRLLLLPLLAVSRMGVGRRGIRAIGARLHLRLSLP